MERRNIPGGGRLSRARRVGRREARNRDPMRFRPPLPALPADYSHIKLQAAPADSQSSEEGAASEYSFIRRQSLQEDLKQQDEDALYNPLPIPNARKARSSPQSFAEAAAMNRSRGRGRSRRGTNETLPDLSGPVTLGSLGTFKVAFKSTKKGNKKWTPIDLNSLDSGTVDSASGLTSAIVSENGSERDTSQPAHPANGQHLRPGANSFRRGTLSEQYIQHSASSPTGKEREDARCAHSSDLQGVSYTSQQLLSDNTPAGSLRSSSENLLPLTPTNLQFLESSQGPVTTPLHKREDSRSTADKIGNIMSRIGGVFDVEEWDEDLPCAGDTESSEQLSVKPQAISYTTVGSVVKSNSAPQFNAPVRIQREGAGRRPSPAALNGRGLDNYYSARTPPPHLGYFSNRPYSTPMGSQNSLYLSQQPQLRSPRTLTEFEKDAYLRSLGVSSPRKPSDERGAQSRDFGVSQQPFQTDTPAAPALHYQSQPKFESSIRDSVSKKPLSLQDTAGDQSNGRSSKKTTLHQHHIFGLDKMQTVQRLASYPNPMQQIAKERLAEFAASKMESVESNTPWRFSHSLPIDAGGAQMQQDTGFQLDTENPHQLLEKGLSDFGFQLPSTNDATSEVPNPLANRSTETLSSRPRSLDLEGLKQHSYKQPPPAYPQPLTAGPPGQRQNFFALAKPISTVLESASLSHPKNDGRADPSYRPESYPYEVAADVSENNFPHGTLRPASKHFRSMKQEEALIDDTLTSEQAAQYYPYGLPDDFSHRESLDENDPQSSYSITLATRESTQGKRSDDWWYAGLKNLELSAEDHCSTFEGREFGRDQRFCPPKVRQVAPVGSERKVLSVDEVKAMSESEVAESLLDNLFGTMMGYADRIPGPKNKAVMSKFVPAPSWAIDNSPNGNTSVFDEYWGQPPKRLARDPRYQAEQRDMSGKY